MDRLFGYDEAFRLGRTHGKNGCILKYNSCPMNVVNLVYLAANMERSAEPSSARELLSEDGTEADEMTTQSTP